MFTKPQLDPRISLSRDFLGFPEARIRLYSKAFNPFHWPWQLVLRPFISRSRGFCKIPGSWDFRDGFTLKFLSRDFAKSRDWTFLIPLGPGHQPHTSIFDDIFEKWSVQMGIAQIAFAPPLCHTGTFDFFWIFLLDWWWNALLSRVKQMLQLRAFCGSNHQISPTNHIRIWHQ